MNESMGHIITPSEMEERLFSAEQLTEVYRAIQETLDSGYPITEERERLLKGAAAQIERAVPDLQERVGLSNQRELEAGMRYEQTMYLSCFDKQAQKLGLTEKGRQALQDAADPSKAHSYRWYVIENINNPDHRVDHDLPLEEAVQLYAGLGCTDKRLGVTKDNIASVDLAIRLDDREWVSEDWTKLDSFRDDPIVAEAAALLQQTMEEQTVAQGLTMGGM